MKLTFLSKLLLGCSVALCVSACSGGQPAIQATPTPLPEDPGLTELTYTVEGSNDLNSWSVLAVNPGSVGESVTVTDESSASAPCRFLRLKVSE